MMRIVRPGWGRGSLLALLPLLLLPAGLSARDGPGKVVMREFTFHPAVLRLSAGRPVTLHLVNAGQLAHQFDAPVLRHIAVTVLDDVLHVEAPGVEVVRLQPGARARLQFVPPRPGRFRFACTIEGHAEAGMVGWLEIR